MSGVYAIGGMHNPCTTHAQPVCQQIGERAEPIGRIRDQASVGACRIARNAAPKRSAFCGPMPWMRSRSSRVAGRVSAILASVRRGAVERLAEAVGAAGERDLGGLEPVEDRGGGPAGEAAARRVERAAAGRR